MSPEAERTLRPQGRFITLEGGEGAGKSTQAKLLADALAGGGISVQLTREPGGAPGAETIRELLLDGDIAWSAPAEVLLHFAARAEHVEQTIRPALAGGTWVVCDRFADSTMAYQGYGLGADRTMIATLAAMVGIEPGLTIVLDVPEPIGRARLEARGPGRDRYERLEAAFHARVAEGFRQIAVAAPKRCVLIEAGGTIAEVHSAILEIVRSRLFIG